MEKGGPTVTLHYLCNCLYLPVTEPQSKSGMILRSETIKPTFDEVFGAFNLLAILWDYKPPLVKSAQVSAERTMNKRDAENPGQPRFPSLPVVLRFPTL